MNNETTQDPKSASACLPDKVNTAILRIAYLIAASDGGVKRAEREVFKSTLCELQGLKMGDDDTTALIQRVVHEAADLAILRDFYNEEEQIKAFLSNVASDLAIIQKSKLACRRAFAVWISICMADKEYSCLEGKLIKALQVACNELTGVKVAYGTMIGAALGAVIGSSNLSEAVAMTNVALDSSNSEMPDSVKKFDPDALIPDSFLEEIRIRYIEIQEVQAQLNHCTSDDERKSIKNSIGYLIELFKEFIDNTEA